MNPPRIRDDQALSVDHSSLSGSFANVTTALVEGPAIDAMDGDHLRAELAALTTIKRHVDARTCSAVSQLTRLEIDQAEAEAPDDARASRRAIREVEQELREDLHITPSQVKTARAVGDRLADVPGLAAAMTTGQITQAHARVLDRTLRHLSLADRERITAVLLDAAARMDARMFGRECRRQLARLDHEAAEHAEQRRHLRRSASATQTPDGMFAVSGQWAGLGAEVVATAIHAFTAPDQPGERRLPEQRTADALVAVCRAALDSGSAPTSHGVKPHLVLSVEAENLTTADGAPIAEAQWTGPVLWPAVRRMLDDCGLSWIAVGKDLPLAVTEEVRTVPVALLRALTIRDNGCIHERCDTPHGWCDVMHLATPYKSGGKLSKGSAGLGCRTHHRRFDAGLLELFWKNGRPFLREPRAGPP